MCVLVLFSLLIGPHVRPGSLCSLADMSVMVLFSHCSMAHMYVVAHWLTLSPAGRVVFHIPDWLHHLLMGGRILVKNTLEAYVDHWLGARLGRVVQEQPLVSLITLLRGTDEHSLL